MIKRFLLATAGTMALFMATFVTVSPHASPVAITFATPAEAQRMVCHNNPECQRKRDAGDIKGAKAALAKPGGMDRSDNNTVQGRSGNRARY